MYMNTSWTEEYAIKITLLFTKIFLILFVHNVLERFKICLIINKIIANLVFS